MEEPRKAGKSLLGHKGLLRHLTSLVEKTVASMPMASMEEVANQAITANVLNTMNFLLQFSDVIRDRVRSGQLEMLGYHVVHISPMFLLGVLISHYLKFRVLAYTPPPPRPIAKTHCTTTSPRKPSATRPRIVGGLFDLQTGRVDFLGPSPDQAVLLDPMASQSPNLSLLV